ncbi:MAG: pyridoxal phosphate-dependent aminotransferase [Balneolaceae bacterium]|nr:pyridoxal phosphate-dependent aminotransferase [Balneolaceae bacterium]
MCDAAIKAINEGFHGYTMNTGMPELREAIVEKLKRDNGLDFAPSQIVCSNGAKQSLGFSMLALIDPGDEVIIPAPYWVSYPQMVKLAEGTSVTIRTAFENDYKMTAEPARGGDHRQNQGVDSLFLPQIPPGTPYTADELRALSGMSPSTDPDVALISDEIYEYITFEGSHDGILQVAPELKDRTLVINGFSKGFAMTGWRLGYMAGPQKVVDAVAKIQSQETSAPSAISQKAGEAAYRGSLDEVTSMRDQFKKRRDYMVDALSAIDGVKCFKPAGAFYVFPDISAHLGKTVKATGEKIETSTDLCMFLIEEVGLAAVPGDAFGEPNGIRLSYASAMEDLKEGIKRLEKGLTELS